VNQTAKLYWKDSNSAASLRSAPLRIGLVMSDFSYGDLPPISSSSRPVDPLEIASSLQIRDAEFSEIWLPQGDALRSWHAVRDKTSVAIALNTGAGKTFVGLVAAVSLANETGGRVLYLCSNIQLVDQTVDKATGYGIPVARYAEQAFTNETAFNEGRAPCVTTYQAAFNGRSRFRNMDISAVVFDDAHTCDQIIRSQYTLDASKADHRALYDGLTDIFTSYFRSIDYGVPYGEIVAGSRDDFVFVPPFVVNANIAAIESVFNEAEPSSDERLKWSWEYIHAHLKLCCFFVSGTEVSVTPAFLPLRSHRLLQPSVRRLYLSATLTANDAFIRTFGTLPDVIISPSTDIGNTERMILVPREAKELQASGIRDIDATKEIISDRKTLISTPTYRRAREWQSVASASRENVAGQVSAFRSAIGPAKLLLVGRYDGVDLPGDTCRVMVIDDLPSGQGYLERFLLDRLRLDRGYRSLLTSRFVQNLGRISRGRRDHGVYILTGERLINWLVEPRTQSGLPPFLRWQIRLGRQLSERQISLGFPKARSRDP